MFDQILKFLNKKNSKCVYALRPGDVFSFDNGASWHEVYCIGTPINYDILRIEEIKLISTTEQLQFELPEYESVLIK